MPWCAGVYRPFAQSQDSPHTWVSKRCSKLDGTPAEPRGCLVRPLDDSIVQRQRLLGQLATLLFIRVANNDGPMLRGPNRALAGFAECPGQESVLLLIARPRQGREQPVVPSFIGFQRRKVKFKEL